MQCNLGMEISVKMISLVFFLGAVLLFQIVTFSQIAQSRYFVLDFHLNIMGSEWIIIIFVALIVLLGTNRLPEVTKKIGKVVGEYNKAKNDVQSQFKDFTNSNLDVSGPVKDERQKLETIAKSLGIDSSKKSDEQLRELISSKIGKPTQETTENKK